MAHTTTRKKAGLKALRADRRRASRTSSTRGSIEVQERMMNKAILAKDTDAVARIQRALQKLYDKAAKRNVLHPKTADRKKSRLAARIARAH